MKRNKIRTIKILFINGRKNTFFNKIGKHSTKLDNNYINSIIIK